MHIFASINPKKKSWEWEREELGEREESLQLVLLSSVVWLWLCFWNFFFLRIYILSRTIFFFFHHLVFFFAMAMKVMVCMIWGSKEYFVHECYVWLLGYMWKLFIHAILTFWDLFFDTFNDSINFQECFSEILIFIRDQRTLLSEILNYVKWN